MLKIIAGFLSGLVILTLSACDPPASNVSSQSTDTTEKGRSDLSGDELFDRALRKYEEGNYKGAIVDYGKAIDLIPEDAEVYSNRGLAYYKSEAYLKAIEDYDKAILFEPNNADFYIKRGIVYDDLQKYSRAIEDYDKAIALNPEIAYAYGLRGFANYNLNNTSQAKQDIETAAKLFKQQGNQGYYQDMLEALKEL